MENSVQENIDGNNFNITWDIKNLFLSFQSEENENPFIRSSEICAQNLRNTKWCLELYPAGLAVGENPSVILRMLDSESAVEEINIGVHFEISTVTDTGSSEIISVTLHPGEGLQCKISYKATELERISKECEDDTILIRCFMRDYSCYEHRTINAVTSTNFNYHACSFRIRISLNETHIFEFKPVFHNYPSAFLKIYMMTKEFDEVKFLRILIVPEAFATCFSYELSTLDDGFIGREMYSKEKGRTMYDFPIYFNRSTSSDSNQSITFSLSFYVKTGTVHDSHYEEL